jgi:Flp pilus assembly protein TadD
MYSPCNHRIAICISRVAGSALLLNGLASAHILMGNYSEAETLLNDALTKPSAETESLANLIVVQQHLQRPVELVNRTIAQLRTKCKGHPLLQALATFEGSFERLAAV